MRELVMPDTAKFHDVNFTKTNEEESGISFHSNPQDRAVLKMMTAVRGALSSCSSLFSSGKIIMSETILKSAIKSAVKDRKITRMPENLVEILQAGLQESLGCSQKRDSVWHLRKALDTVYDEYVDMYCGVKSATFGRVHQTISNIISLAVTMKGKNSETQLKDLYLKSIKSILMSESLSEESCGMLQKAVQDAECDCEIKTQVFILRNALDGVYNEVRLPDMHKKLSKIISGNAMVDKEAVLLDFTGETEPTLNLSPKLLNDTVMGGESTSEFKPTGQEAIFEGYVSTARDGGFASVKFHPETADELRSVLKSCIGFIITAKNLTEKVQRFKFQLASQTKMRSFNYQSEILLPPGSECTPVFLHISTFWPTMFGHVLADQGKVDTNEVDTVGFIVSKLSDNGKVNPDFAEGKFALAIKSVKVKY